MNTEDLTERLRKRFAPPQYAIVEEVPNATGTVKSRSIDAVAMSLWPSRGIELHGFELKVSRGDWLRELKNPAKADVCVTYMDRWWIVAGDGKIVWPGELPPNWGLLVAKGSRLVVVAEAPQLTPKPIDRTFLAGLMRSVNGHSPSQKALTACRVQAYEEGRKDAEAFAVQATERHKQNFKRLEEKIAEFEKQAGFSLDQGWRYGRSVGEVVQSVLRGDFRNSERDMQQLAASAESILTTATKCLKLIQEHKASDLQRAM